MSDSYLIWINAERTVMVRIWGPVVGHRVVWDSSEMEVAMRDDPSHTWGPPVRVEPERVA